MYRWKGKLCTKKVYEQRIRTSNLGKAKKITDTDSSASEPCDAENAENEENDAKQQEPGKSDELDCAKGQRIVELKILADELWCVSCKECLSLQNVENELRRGLSSILSIRCHKCLLINQVRTGTQRCPDDKRNAARFDINYKTTLGVLNNGMGYSHLNKLCAAMNVPCMDCKTFKKHEEEIGKAEHHIAKKSCSDTAALEQEQTIKNDQLH